MKTMFTALEFEIDTFVYANFSNDVSHPYSLPKYYQYVILTMPSMIQRNLK